MDETKDEKLLCAMVKEAGHIRGGRGRSMRLGAGQRHARWDGVSDKQKGDDGGTGTVTRTYRGRRKSAAVFFVLSIVEVVVGA